jgi:hypothetical protein
MLCDFGLSKILTSNTVIDSETYRNDITRLCLLMATLFTKVRPSPEAHAVFDGGSTQNPKVGKVFNTVREMMAMPWFSMTAVAPIPKSPTPLLRPNVVWGMGFDPPLNPAGVPVDEEIEPEKGAGSSRGSERMESLEIEEPSRARHTSLGHRVRNRISSVGQAISQPFRRLSSRSSRHRRNQDQ